LSTKYNILYNGQVGLDKGVKEIKQILMTISGNMPKNEIVEDFTTTTKPKTPILNW
jgi:hypothetical protein